MSYQSALEAAGAIVLAYESFGDYQGSWYAKVQRDGKTFFVAGSYGSCSGCDAFEAEFDYKSHEHKGDKYISVYDPSKFDIVGCEKCAQLHKQLAEFGEGYLSDERDWISLYNEQVKNLEWDSEAKQVIAWLEANK